MRHTDPFDVARKAYESCGAVEDFCPFSRERSPILVRQPLRLNPDYEYPALVASPIAFYSDESLEADRLFVQPFTSDSDEKTESASGSCENSSEYSSISDQSLVEFEKKVFKLAGWKTSEDTSPSTSQASSPVSVKSEIESLSDVKHPAKVKFAPIEEENAENFPVRENSSDDISNRDDENHQILQKQQRLEKVLRKIHAIKSMKMREIVTKMPKMIGDDTLMISVDALRDDGRILKHFNIPIDLPSLNPLSSRQSSSSKIRALPLKKRYQRVQEPEERPEKMMRRSRKNILKGMLQETKMKSKRVSVSKEIVCEDVPLDLSRISHREPSHRPPVAQRIPPASVPQPILHPIPLRYLMQPVRPAEEPPQVSRFYPEIPARNLPPYNYPHMLIEHSSVARPMPLYPIPARYYERYPEAPLPSRKSFQIPPNSLQVPYRTQHISYPQYPPAQYHYLPHPSVISRPVPAEKPRTDQLVTYAFHPPQLIPQSSFVAHQVPQFRPQVPPTRPNPPIAQGIQPNYPRSVKAPSERHHIRNLLLENGTMSRVQPVKTSFSDEIPIFRVRNPTYRGTFPTQHEPHPSGMYYSHATQ